MDRLKSWLHGAAEEGEEIAKGGEPVESGERERETSTNAQVAGASDEPWPGKD